MAGDGIPGIPHWGLMGKADEFWTANDFEILGACYRREVEDFLNYLNNHHEFPGAKKELRSKVRTTSPAISTESLSKRSSTSPPTPTIVPLIFAPGEADSYTFCTPRNLNTSVFGHSAQNSSSIAFRELLGGGQPKRRHQGCVKVNNPPPTTPVTQVNRILSGGAPGPGDSDRDDVVMREVIDLQIILEFHAYHAVILLKIHQVKLSPIFL